jgi:hypothetical protein
MLHNADGTLTAHGLIVLYTAGTALFALAVAVFLWAFFGGIHALASPTVLPPRADADARGHQAQDVLSQVRADLQRDLQRRPSQAARDLRLVTEIREGRPVPPRAA